MFPNMCTHSSNTNMAIENNTDDNYNLNLTAAPMSEDLEMAVDDNCIAVESNTVFNSILDANNSQVTYNDVLEIASDLCRTVSNDPKLCKITYATIFEWITKLREGDKFEIKFVNTALLLLKRMIDIHHLQLLLHQLLEEEEAGRD